jgi:selenocysteine-specific elongation factor
MSDAPPGTPAGAAAAPPLTLGTAGHIDHGKTALVRALTGHDTDRLAAERERGISIELGYAPLVLADGRRLSAVDVPGHERFVRTMVAGATGIDLYLLVVAADDGVMPQTREHWTVLEALDVRAGVVAITKADVADPARAAAQARELVGEGPAIVACSGVTGAGVEDVRAAIGDVAAAHTPSTHTPATDAPVLHIDRSFTIRGAGTVVTGTLWAGVLEVGQELTLLPAGRPVRVRGLQVHDAPVERAGAGQRVAVNLARVERDAVGRGDVLAGPAGLEPAWILDARLELTSEPTGHVHVHHGTRETPARLVALGGGTWQVRARDPLLARAGDRLVIRASAPPDTIGGGVVLAAPARRRGPSSGDLRWVAPAYREQPCATPAEPPPLDDATLAVEQELRDAGWEPPPNAQLDADAALAALRAHGRAVRLGRDLHIHVDALAEARARVVALIETEGSTTLARVRDELGTSRRYAQVLLERLDADHVTLRRPDDHRVLRRRG